MLELVREWSWEKYLKNWEIEWFYIKWVKYIGDCNRIQQLKTMHVQQLYNSLNFVHFIFQHL